MEGTGKAFQTEGTAYAKAYRPDINVPSPAGHRTRRLELQLAVPNAPHSTLDSQLSKSKL